MDEVSHSHEFWKITTDGSFSDLMEKLSTAPVDLDARRVVVVPQYLYSLYNQRIQQVDRTPRLSVLNAESEWSPLILQAMIISEVHVWELPLGNSVVEAAILRMRNGPLQRFRYGKVFVYEQQNIEGGC